MGMENAIVDAGAPVRHLITVEEFLILDRAGVFRDVGRVELVEGEIYVMSPIHRPHARIQLLLTVAVHEAVERSGLSLHAFTPVSARLDPHNLPEADIVVATEEEDDFISPASIRLAIEVAVSSLAYDLGKKAMLYARTGVPEYWVVNVSGSEIIRMADPVGDVYRARDTFAFGTAISCATLPEIIVDTATLA